MGFCPGANQSQQRGASTYSTQNEIVTIWGDYFSPQTRTIIAILDHSNIRYKIEKVDTMLGEINEEEMYHKIVLPNHHVISK